MERRRCQWKGLIDEVLSPRLDPVQGGAVSRAVREGGGGWRSWATNCYVGLEYNPTTERTEESLGWIPNNLRGGDVGAEDLKL
jgi:hypothetical protein